MSSKQKKKLCWNCEARVTYKEEYCPNCGVYLSPESTAILNPPYQMGSGKENQGIPASPFSSHHQDDERMEDQDQSAGEEIKALSGDVQSFVIPLALLLSGSVFLLFGVILWLFSDQGVFTLHWNGNYWYFYLLLAVPLLLFGWKTLQNLNDEG